MYVPRKGVREAIGIALFCHGRIQVVAPDDYVGPFLSDPSSEAGFAHCFLKPYQGAIRGLVTRKGKVQPDTSLRSVAYVLVEERKPNGLLCVGAVSLSRAQWGYTFCFFPAMRRLAPSELEVDHLTAHVRFSAGRLIVDKLQARVRLESESHAKGKIPLRKARHDDNHFAFEFWVKDVDNLDPAGSVGSSLKSPWVGKAEERTIRKVIERTQPFTFGCSLPTEDGRGPIGLPVFVRVGVVMHRGIAEVGGAERVLSQPHGAVRPTPARIHRYVDPSRLRPEWPADASIFMEVGELTETPPNDYGLPDISKSEVEKLRSH